MSDVLFLLSGRLGNSLRLILVLGFFGGFLGKSRNFIVFYFLPSLDHPCHLRSKVPPPPSLGMLLEKAFPSNGNWNLCSYTMYKFCECFFCRFVHRHGYLANQFIFFFSKFVFSGQLKWCTEGNSFSSPYITSFLPYLYFPLSQRSSGCRSNKLTKKIIVFPFSQFSWSLWLLGCKLKKKNQIKQYHLSLLH